MEVFNIMEDEDKISDLKQIAVMSMKSCSTSYEANALNIFLHDESFISAKIVILADLSFSIFLYNQVYDRQNISHLLSNPNTFTYITELSNTIAYLHHVIEGPVLSAQEKALRYIESMDIDDNDVFLSFMKEQLQLLVTSPQKRRYSPKMFSKAYFWRNASVQCYKILREIF